jgi:4-amino-4-deoxy-L-arabinose transferase-like glycosyltransferase
MTTRAAHLAIAGGCAAFLAVSLWHLDRVPPIHNDEPTILAPGWKLVTRGVFGLDMLDGLDGADRHYLEVMPAMSVVEGAVAGIAGPGVWPMRAVPAVLGAATLALAGLLALRLAGPAASAVTVGVLLLWQWTPGGAPFLPTGIPLLDISRIARYDILAAPLGLAALLAALAARTSGSSIRLLASGALVGLATLATPYGAFWGVAVALVLAIEARGPADGVRRAARETALVAAAGAIVLLPWVVYAAMNWSDLLGQYGRHAGRFDFGDPAFYLDSVLHEGERYELGVRSPATYARVGFWLLAVGVPAAFAWLARRAWANRDRRAVWLLVPCAVQPTLLALLVNEKRFYYLAAVVPLFAVLLGWAFAALLAAPRRAVRWAAGAVLAVTATQGVFALARVGQAAAGVGPPAAYFARLRKAVGPGCRRIVGPHAEWFAFPERDYLSFTVPVSIMAAEHESLRAAFASLAPDAVLLTPYVVAAYTHQTVGPGPATAEALRAMLASLGLARTEVLADNRGSPIEVWSVHPPSPTRSAGPSAPVR